MDTPQPGTRSGFWLVAAAALLWSTSGFFAKAPVFDRWDPDTRVLLMAFWRAVFASLLLGCFVRRPQWSWRMAPMMASFVAMCWAFLQALVNIESSSAIWLQYTAPVFVVLGGVFLFREPLLRQDAWFVGAAFSGLAIILYGEVGRVPLSGLVYGVMSGVFFAGVVLSLRSLRDYDAAWLVFLNQGATAVALLPAVLHAAPWPAGWQWGYLAGFGVLQLALPYYLFALGIRRLRSQEASLVALLEPIFVPVWVYLVWRHSPDYLPPGPATLVGAAIILAALLFRYSQKI